ncbi:MAG TPA: MliC family protein [Burkholderiaceae bacterium]|nr:MliC family protein [Burkholderiaceae bacterium]HQR71261.1 MliC family protein [Burkholderiaceae bacterium]
MTALALLALAAATSAAPASADETPVSTLVFLCDQAWVPSLVQPKAARPGQPVDLTFGPETRRMQPAVAASGARYLSSDGTWEWWGKGTTGRLTAADGLPLAANCSLYLATGKVPRPDKP